MEQITNLYKLKCYLKEQYDKNQSYDECVKILNSYQIVGVGDIQEYFDYLMPIQLMLEEQSNQNMLGIPSQAQKAINDQEAKKIQLQTKESK